MDRPRPGGKPDARDALRRPRRDGVGFRRLELPDRAPWLRAGAILVTNGRRISTQSVTIGGTVSNPSDVTIVPDTVPCIDDVHVDGLVNGTDLGVVLAGWGPCPD
jgi:hypothetical protein